MTITLRPAIRSSLPIAMLALACGSTAALAQALPGPPSDDTASPPPVSTIPVQPVETETPPPAAEAVSAAEPAQLGEVVVTAQKTKQSSRKVPISLTALSGDFIRSTGAASLNEVALYVPNARVEAHSPGSPQVYLRGFGTNAFNPAFEGSVAFVQDDLFFGRPGYFTESMYDIDRVEVLRGPQGTLFGSGAEGGAVRFLTPEPSLDRATAYGRAEVSGTKGGSASGEGGIAFGAPLVQDKLGFRVSVWAQHLGGYVDRKNLNPELDGTAPVHRNANTSDAVVARAALAFRPSSDVTISPSVLFQDNAIHDIGTFWEGQESANGGRLVNGQPIAQPDHDRFVLPAIRAQVDLAGVRLIANLSYLDRIEVATTDYSTLIPAIFNPPHNNVAGDTGYVAYAQMRNVQTAWTGELRAQSIRPGAALTWTIGLFASAAQQKAYEAISDPAFGEVLGAPPEDVFGQALIDGRYSLVGAAQGLDRQAALFGEASYALTTQLKLTAGLRVARATFIGQSYATGPFVGATIISPRASTTETPVTPKVALAWQATADTLLYASASKGYRIGGTNAPLSDFCDIGAQGYSSVPSSYRSDSLWSYELGAKTRLFDRHVELAASAWHVDWSNIQQLVYVSNCGQQFVDNLGHARSNGFDLQMTLRPVKGFTIDGALGFVSATYTRTIPYLVQVGDHIDTQPWSGTVGATYETALSAALTGYARADFIWHSRSGLTPVLDPANGGYDPAALPAPATRLVNLRAGVRLARFDISAFVNNLFNARPLLTRYSEVIGNPVHRDFTFRPLSAGLTGTFRY